MILYYTALNKSNPRLNCYFILSFYRSNRRYFEAFQISPIVQEMLRTCDPQNAFLALNLRSIIFNLGQGKSWRKASCKCNAFGQNRWFHPITGLSYGWYGLLANRKLCCLARAFSRTSLTGCLRIVNPRVFLKDCSLQQVKYVQPVTENVVVGQHILTINTYHWKEIIETLVATKNIWLKNCKQ